MTEVVGMRVPATALLTEDARVSAAITPSTTPGTLSVFLVALIPAFLIRTMRVVAMVPVVSNGIASLAAVSEPWAPTITSTVAFIVMAAHVLVTTICAWTGLLALVPASLVLDFIILRCLDIFGLQCVLGVCGLFNRLLWLVILAHMTEVVGMRVPATALLTEDARVSAAITPSTTPGTLSVFLVALIPAFLIRTMRVVA